MRRRQFCTTLTAGGGLIASAGCLQTFGVDGLRLGGVVLVNRRERPVEGRLQVTRGETTVLDEEFALAAPDSGGRSGLTRHDAWDDRVAVYEVTVEVAPATVESFEYTEDERDGDCTVAMVLIHEQTVAFGSHEASEQNACEQP